MCTIGLQIPSLEFYNSYIMMWSNQVPGNCKTQAYQFWSTEVRLRVPWTETETSMSYTYETLKSYRRCSFDFFRRILIKQVSERFWQCYYDDVLGGIYHVIKICFSRNSRGVFLRRQENLHQTKSYKRLQKWWDTPTEKRPFLRQIAPCHRSVKYNTDLPPPSHSKLFLQVLNMVLYC